MANPFSQKARQRKVIYTALILVLFTGSLMHRRLWVEPEAERLKLREVARGEVELTSSAVRLTLTGSRGLAVTFLWAAAIDQQERHEWNELELLVGAITKLQPYFITPWLFQGWNLAYNVAVECDQPRDKYYYVSRGLHLLAEGERRNDEQGLGQPDLRHFIGIAYQGKIGISDEKNAMRSLLDLSCIDPLRRDPKRFWARGADGRETVNLDEFARFCRDHPRLVRRLRETLNYSQPNQIVAFLAANQEVPSRFEKPVGGPDQKETPLKKDPREQFPIVPHVGGELSLNPGAVDFGIGPESLDIHVVSRAWFQYAQQPLPPFTFDASIEEWKVYDPIKYRVPKAPALVIFRGYPARAQAYSAEILGEEGFFDQDGWLVKDWFEQDGRLGADEFRVGTETKYHVGPAWERAYRLYRDLGIKTGQYFTPSEFKAIEEKAEEFRTAYKHPMNQPGPVRLAAKDRDNPKLVAGLKAHDRLYWRGASANMTNFEGHLTTAEAERTPDAVLSRNRFFHAERMRRFENDPEQALALYQAAWPGWVGVLLRHPQFADQSGSQEDSYELQYKNLVLAQRQRSSQLKGVLLALAQFGVWPYPPLDELVPADKKNQILPYRNMQGLLDWTRLYDVPGRDELSRGVLAWTQAAGMPRLFLYPGQEDWTLTALDHRTAPLGNGWRNLIADNHIDMVKTRLGIVKQTPAPATP